MKEIKYTANVGILFARAYRKNIGLLADMYGCECTISIGYGIVVKPMLITLRGTAKDLSKCIEHIEEYHERIGA